MVCTMEGSSSQMLQIAYGKASSDHKMLQIAFKMKGSSSKNVANGCQNLRFQLLNAASGSQNGRFQLPNASNGWQNGRFQLPNAANSIEMSTAKLEKVNSLDNFLPRTHARTHTHTPVCARLICFCLLCRPNAAKCSSVHLQGHWQEFDNFATCLQMVPTFPLRIELACCLLRWL